MTPTAPHTEYAFWTEATSAFKVTYSLGVFHEIDFQVNEGYRRIPHGGIEIGGLLFGSADGQSAKIEDFRLIDCEHAFGPSFVLSERDVSALQKQLKESKGEPELEGMEVLGWFVAHTRTPLEMSDREARLFDDLFPEPRRIMLLVKPERFQPTRFGFLVRGTDGNAPRNAIQQAIILPLPGRAARSEEGPLPSIPAPVERPPKPEGSSGDRTTQPIASTHAKPNSRPSGDRVSAKESSESLAPKERSAPSATPERDHKTTTAPEPAPIRTRQPEEVLSLVPFESGSLPSIEEVRRRRWEYLQSMGYDPRTDPLLLTGEVEPQSFRSNLRLALVLFLAAAIGCGVGYWGYSQLPSATIPLSIQPQPSDLLVSWPPDQTRDAGFAAIRINDGEEVPLSPLQRAAGQAKVAPPADNMKIEVIAQHWMRDSHGIVRYVRPVPPVEAHPVETVKPAARRTPTPPPAEEDRQ